MKKNQRIPDFGDLNHFFDEGIDPQAFMDELTDIIEEYSRLAVMNEQQIIPFETACRISTLGNLHKEIRKIVR